MNNVHASDECRPSAGPFVKSILSEFCFVILILRSIIVAFTEHATSAISTRESQFPGVHLEQLQTYSVPTKVEARMGKQARTKFGRL